MKLQGFVIILLLWWVSPAFAQFSIKGTVIDQKSGEKLPGANVRLENSTVGTQTDAKGQFLFNNLKTSEYQLIVSYIGYNTLTEKIKIAIDTQLTLYLVPGVILKETAIIQATRVPVNAPATLTYLNKKEIESKNNGLDLPFLLSGIPSAVITSDAGTGIGYTGIRIRGTDMTRINVTVNGIPFNDPESHEVYWVDMPDIASSIDNIEIQRGVGTSSNGAASFGGSINIVTSKTQEKPSAEINTSAGSFHSLRTTVNAGTGLIKGKFAVDVRGSKISSDGYIDRATADLKSFFISGTYLTQKSLFKVNVFTGKERTYQAWDGIPSEILDTNRTFNVNGMYYDASGNMAFYKNEVDDYRQDNYQFIYNQDLPGKMMLTTALHYTHGSGYYEQYKQDENPLDYGLTSPGDTIPTTNLVTRKWLCNDFYGMTWSLIKNTQNLSLTLGGAWNQYLGDHYGTIIWSDHPFEQLNANYRWYFNDGDKIDANIFTKMMWNLSDKIGLLADIQYRTIDYTLNGVDDDYRILTQEHHYNFINPKSGIQYSPSSHNKFHLYWGIANREPNRTNFKDADPGHTPNAERLTNYELGYELDLHSIKASANLYFMNYRNQLVLTGKINNVGAPVMVNVPKSYRLGLELTAEVQFATWLRWGGNLTLSRNKIKQFTEFVDDWSSGSQILNEHNNTDLSFSPGIIANNHILFKLVKNLHINLLTKYTGMQYIDNTFSNDRKLNPYLVQDISLSYSLKYKLIKNLEFSLLINNIFNELYETNAWVYRYYYEGKDYKMDGYFPQATRNFMAGLKIKL